MARRVFVVMMFALLSGPCLAQSTLTLEQAIRKAVATNPRVGEAAANRRAVDQELRAVQGALLPQVRLQAEYGNERFRAFDRVGTTNSNEWRKAGGEVGVVASQLLFDGFATIHEIYRQMARSDAAGWRAYERAELVALDTAEAFLDVIRYSQSVAHANLNVAAHERLAANVSQRFSGGRAGRGDSQQVQERLAAAKAVRAELMTRLEASKAAFRRAVGSEPTRLTLGHRISGLPSSRQAALEQTIAGNPTLRAATSDVTAAERQYDSSAGLFLPRVSLEARAKTGRDSSENIGKFDEASGKLRVEWNIFSGGSDTARRTELAERVAENRMRLDSLRRAAFESVDRAWGVRSYAGARVGSLQAQVAAAQQVVAAYRGEYELGQRTLLDLLNAENDLFNAKLSLEGARAVTVFADYQLLATTGQLIARLRVSAPVEARAVPSAERSVFPTSFGNPMRGAIQ